MCKSTPAVFSFIRLAKSTILFQISGSLKEGMRFIMKIAAYCRVSTEKEAQIDSLEKQIEFFNEFTKKNGYELYKLYADEGISGKQIKHRKQFQQMMLDAKAKKFDKVIVKDVSRFARNTVDLLQSVRELKSYNVQVDFLNNGEVMEGGSEFILTILGAMA